MNKIVNPLISILMPTYNDCKTIINAIESVINQSHKNWELIIINDGSSDDTEKIVSDYLTDTRIILINLENNRGQLLALNRGVREVSGDYVTLLHSDDILANNFSLSYLIKCINGRNFDGLYADLIRVDESLNQDGIIKTSDTISLKTLGNLFLSNGSNSIPDVFFVKNDVFFKRIVPQYITWNMPYWFSCMDGSVSLLNLYKVRPWYKYRIYHSNIIHSDIGKFEVTNGCLRTVLTLSDFFDGSTHKRDGLYYWISQIMKKLNLQQFKNQKYSGSYYKLVQNIFLKYYGRINPSNIYEISLLNFYKNYPSNNIIEVPEGLVNEKTKALNGCDSRIFFKQITMKTLEPEYKWVLDNARNGFNMLIVKNEYEKEIMRDILNFLNLKASIYVGK